MPVLELINLSFPGKKAPFQKTTGLTCGETGPFDMELNSMPIFKSQNNGVDVI